jgi:hypothetical protein
LNGVEVAANAFELTPMMISATRMALDSHHPHHLYHRGVPKYSWATASSPQNTENA